MAKISELLAVHGEKGASADGRIRLYRQAWRAAEAKNEAHRMCINSGGEKNAQRMLEISLNPLDRASMIIVDLVFEASGGTHTDCIDREATPNILPLVSAQELFLENDWEIEPPVRH